MVLASRKGEDWVDGASCAEIIEGLCGELGSPLQKPRRHPRLANLRRHQEVRRKGAKIKMKPDFEKMTSKELREYALAHQEDIEP